MRIDLGDGESILAEVFEADGGADLAGEGPPVGTELSGDAARSKVPVPAWANVEEADQTVRSLARWLHRELVGRMEDLVPRRVGVEFGVKLTADLPGTVRFVLGHIGAELSLVVRLEWEPDRMTPGSTEVAADGWSEPR
jgi:hypothetical protein